MYDDTCRFLAEHFSADFASWLLGESIALTEIKPSELSLEPIRAVYYGETSCRNPLFIVRS
jgi:predicted transposase YdaD